MQLLVELYLKVRDFPSDPFTVGSEEVNQPFHIRENRFYWCQKSQTSVSADPGDFCQKKDRGLF